MNCLKKILSFVLICAMLTSTFVTVGASETEPTITVASKDVYPGGNVDISIDLSNNPGIISMLLDVDYDNTYLTLTKVTNGTTLKGATHDTTALTSKPYTLSWADDTATENNTANGTIVTFSFSVANSAPVASYPITVTYDNDNAAIYDKDMNLVDFAVVNGSINVLDVPKENFTGITLSDKTYTYDGTEKTVSVSGTVPSGASVVYENNKATKAGEYNVKATVSKDGYNDLVLNSKLTINPKAVSVSGLSAQNKTYDGTTDAQIKGGTLVGKIEGDDVSCEMPVTGTFASKNADEDVTVTIDELTLTGEDSFCYTLTQPSSLKADIAPAPIYVKADDITMVKGAQVPELTYTITSGELFGNDQIEGSLTTKATGSKLGTFDIAKGTLAVNSNYKMTFTKGTLTVVDKTPQVIKVSEITPVTYGSDGFTVEVTPDETSGLAEFTFESSNTDVAEIDAEGNVTIKNAGTTEITVAQAGDDTYAPFTKTQLLVVEKVKLTVTADGKTKIIGSDDPELTYSVEGELVNGDEFVGSIEREPGEDVGTYDILIGSLEVNDNYDITYNKAVFEILPKTIQKIQVSEISAKTYGDEDFAVEVIPDDVSGLSDFEFESSNLEVAEIDAEGNVTIKNAGTTEITVTQAGDDTYAPYTNVQTLTVNKAQITITANPVTKRIGTADPELTYEVTGTLVGEDTITGSLVREEGEELGYYDILIGTLAVNTNYEIKYNSAVFAIVDKTPQNITVATLPEVTYGDAPVAITVTADAESGLADFEFDSSNAKVATVSEDGVITIVGAGEAAITVFQAGNDEYASFEYTAKFVVNPKEVSISAIDIENKVVTIDGLVAEDTLVSVDFDAMKIEVTGQATDTTSNIKISNLALCGDKANNYALVTETVESTIATDKIATVTLVSENGTLTGAGAYLKGTQVTITAKPASRYSFVAWLNGEEKVSTDKEYTFIVNEDITLTAQFKKKSSSPAPTGPAGSSSYTITYSTNGGSKIGSQKVSKGEVVAEPQNPQKDGYTFAGWYTDKNLTNKYDFATKVTKNMTLYAAWEEEKTVEDMIILTLGEKTASVFGEEKENDVAPIAINNRTMLPARFVAESLGAKVMWNAEEPEKIVITKGETKIVIILNAEKATVNGEEVTLDSPAITLNDRTYTPVRFICESLGAKVDWNSKAQQVIITK